MYLTYMGLLFTAHTCKLKIQVYCDVPLCQVVNSYHVSKDHSAYIVRVKQFLIGLLDAEGEGTIIP
jgi:hypothetical protein